MLVLSSLEVLERARRMFPAGKIRIDSDIGTWWFRVQDVRRQMFDTSFEIDLL
jgi:hypothetical protein